jgi:hypothetical protein
MVENMAITNNDKEEQNITKSKTTESVEVSQSVPFCRIEMVEDGRVRTFQLYLSLAP